MPFLACFSSSALNSRLEGEHALELLVYVALASVYESLTAMDEALTSVYEAFTAMYEAFSSV